ncbi:MAG: hypothetical protein ABI846_07415 [Rudaea sp.]
MSLANHAPAVAAPRLFERVRILTIQPVGYAHSAAFAELAEGLASAYSALGADVDMAINQALLGDGVNIVFGAHLIAAGVALPGNAIIFNLEQLNSGILVQPHYLDLLRRHVVFDYSPRNAALVREQTGNAHVHVVRIGYAPVLTRIEKKPAQDVDVLFYGVVNERRRRILDGLAAAGLNVRALPGIYGRERDAWVARSKVVLNIHFYEDKIHEIVRTSYLLANAKAVVSECDAQTEIDDDVRTALVCAPYDALVATCVALVRDDERRERVERLALEGFRGSSQADVLAGLLPRLHAPLPPRINLGSGKAFDAERLNIDIDPKWNPDVVANLCAPGGLRQIFFSRRFGLVRLEPGQFDEISTIDVLEHVPDLSTMMTRCLELLRVGATMRIVVPYDLSWGAWQDPTHVRAFNERSWLYYTDWHWYLGWAEARFDMADMKMKLSAVGDAMLKRGVAHDEVFRTPRAVDEMQVVLVKRLLTAAESENTRKAQRGAGDTAA